MSIALPARFHERLVAECPDAVIYADAAGNVRYWNAAATRTFGFSAIEAIGSRLDLIIVAAQATLGRLQQGHERRSKPL